MFLSTETARSDFFLVSAILLFGSLLTSLLAGLVPFDPVSYWVDVLVLPVLLIIAPIWLQKARKQPLSDLYRGSLKDALLGVAIALPVLLGVLAIRLYDAGVSLYFIAGTDFAALLKWIAVGFSMAFLVQRADIAFPGMPAPANALTLRIAGVLIGLGVIAGLGFVTVGLVHNRSFEAVISPLTVAFLAVGAALSWALAERVIGLSGNINRNAWITVAAIYVLAEINIFGIITNFSNFAFELILLAPLGALVLATLAAWEMRKSVWFGYGMAVVYALAGVPGNTGVV